MTMSRRDYELIAQTIAEITQAGPLRQRIADKFAVNLAYAYPNFDAKRFLAAALKGTQPPKPSLRVVK